MLFGIDCLIELNLIILFAYLIYKTTSKNRNHLSYLKIYLGSIILTILIEILQKWIPLESSNIATGLGVLGLPFLLLHTESAITGHKPVMYAWYFAPITIYCLMCILNYYEIFILNFTTSSSLILDINPLDTAYSSDKILVKVLSALFFVSLIFLQFKKEITNSKQIQKKKAYCFWIFSYLLFLLIQTLLIYTYYFNLFNPIYNSTIKNIVLVVGSFVYVAFLFNPNLFYYLSLISKCSAPTIKKTIEPFQIIENLMQKEQLFLNKSLSLKQICIKADLYQQKITAIIKQQTNSNWKCYVNTYRINYALKLIHNHYLKNKSVKALGEEVGFNSKQSFFRAFRTKTGTTPSVYYKNYLKKNAKKKLIAVDS